MIIVAYIFFALGVIFNLMGNIGVLIFPDVYTRLQASSTCATTSVLSILIGCLIYAGWGTMTGRLIVITLFFFVTNPISSHIIARFAWQRGVVPWRKSYARGDKDESGDEK